ncbi:MAG: endolytic transglycosylase MltG, partial [Burkholderiales bacterium]
TKALYFVSRGDGTTYFSDSLEEHNRAVTKYQKSGHHNQGNGD